MSTIEEKAGAHSLLEEMKLLKEIQDHCGVKKPINSDLWHACAGPLVTLPQVGSLVYYFTQGHSEQVAATTKRTATTQVPNYPNLPSQLLCKVLNTTLHADKDTDDIYAQISLQPLNSEKDVFPITDIGVKPSKHSSDFFCKTLTPSDTSTHGGFSVPRRAAETLFPQLDFTMQPPNQELIIRDLHDNTWTFRHIYRGQPKRHLLTTGWSMFVGAKRLKAGDAVIFIRDEKSQLLLGIRRAKHQQTASPSSVLSADSMHLGVLAAAAHAAANQSPFTIFYNPRACRSEFVIPLAEYQKSVYGIKICIGMRFGMMFETEESGKRRYMGTITGISDVDPLRWPGSKWHNLQVEWDDPVCNDGLTRVSPWDIETPESLFIFSSLTSTLKRPFGSTFIGEQPECNNKFTRPFIRAPQATNTNFINHSLTQSQTVNNIGPVSPFFPNDFPKMETVKPEPSPLEPPINPQNLINGPPIILNELSSLEQPDPSLCGFLNDDVYNCINFEGCNTDNPIVDQPVSSVVLDEICGFKDDDIQNPSGYELLDSSGGTASSNGEFNEMGLVCHSSWNHLGPPARVRTYTKIQKAGSVGRSIDVSSFQNYDELCSEIEKMFGLEGLLNNSTDSGWKLVYVDFENDVLLVGDDPWGEFVGCVRCIRILSPSEVKQMGEEGMQLLNNSTAALQALIA